MRRDELRQAMLIARRAGEVLLRHYGRVTATNKADRSWVTEADREAERLIRRELEAAFPGDAIVGEEFGLSRADSRRAWFVDPLDGTTNFVCGLPLWCVSLGLLEGDEAVLGVIHDPLHKLTYHGAPGLGAFVNDRPLTPWPGGGPFERTDPVVVPPEVVCRGIDFGAEVRLRCLGSAALHFAYVAGGGARAGLWAGEKGWDVIGGIALARAAGVEVTDARGEAPPLATLRDGERLPWLLCAAAPGTHRHLLERLAASGVTR